MSRRVVSLVLAVVSALGSVVVLLPPAPAWACSCAMAGAKQYVKWSDVVFAGTLVEVTPPPAAEVMSSSDPATYEFEVEAVFKGDVGSRTAVDSAVSGASCGLEGMTIGRDYVVYAAMGNRGAPNRLGSGLCSGTAPASPRNVASLERVTGPGSPVVVADPVPSTVPSPASPTGPPVVPPEVEVASPNEVDEPGEGAGGWGLAVGGVGLALLLAGGWWVARRRMSD